MQHLNKYTMLNTQYSMCRYRLCTKIWLYIARMDLFSSKSRENGAGNYIFLLNQLQDKCHEKPSYNHKRK